MSPCITLKNKNKKHLSNKWSNLQKFQSTIPLQYPPHCVWRFLKIPLGNYRTPFSAHEKLQNLCFNPLASELCYIITILRNHRLYKGSWKPLNNFRSWIHLHYLFLILTSPQDFWYRNLIPTTSSCSWYQASPVLGAHILIRTPRFLRKYWIFLLKFLPGDTVIWTFACIIWTRQNPSSMTPPALPKEPFLF